MPYLPALSPTLLSLWTGFNVIALLVIALLVTRWWRDHENLARSHVELDEAFALTQAALESTSSAILVVDLEGQVLTCNRRFIELWNLPENWPRMPDLEKRLEYLAFQVRDPERFYRCFNPFDHLAVPSDGDLLAFRDGRVIECSVMPYRAERGGRRRVRGRLYTYMDITARKEADTQVQALLNQAQSHARRLVNLRTASANVSIEVNLKGVLKSILLNAASLLDAAVCELYLVQPETYDVLHTESAPKTLQPPSDGLCCTPPALQERALHDGRGTLIEPGMAQPLAWSTTGPGRPRSLITVPLLSHREPIGLLTVTELHRAAPFNADDLQLMELFAQQSAIAIQNALLFEETNRLATTDALTGLYNRHQWLVLARRELERAHRYNLPFTVIMFDIDHFKQVNDSQGHPVGDQVLRWLADRSQSQLRRSDILGRCGGEEFLVMLPHTPILEGMLIAERLRAWVAREPFHTGSRDLPITISLGVVAWSPDLASLEMLLERADQALYASKETGRNKVTGVDAASGKFLPGVFTAQVIEK